MFALVVRFDLRDEHAATQFDAITGELVDQVTAKEPGTLIYVAHTIEGAPLGRLFYEVYADPAAFETHNETEHVKAFLAARAAFIADRRVERLTPAHAKGLPDS
ncbi:MAG: antibiotic biosynthesis monooxygenase [Actinobacteria bacterium 13_2_20CM_2_71_6]|nr:MAG: antibiotic biosynthesis monooxygenase [Actinobacteria bacterium 13_2_20CM_2_71_6]